MCVSTGPRICLVCLLLYSWHARAEEPDIGGIPLQYDDIHTKPDIPAEVDDDTSELYFMEKDYFLTKLMNKYGNGVEMTYEGFEHLLYHLGLGGVLKFDHSVSCHKVDNSSEFLQIHLHHNHSAEANQSSRICLHEEEHSHEHKHVVSHDHSHDDHEHTHNEQEHLHGDNEHNVKDKGIEHEDKEDHDHEGHSHDHGDHEHNQDHNMHHDDNLEHSIVEHEHDEKENSTAGVHNHSDHDDSHEHDHLDHNHNHKEIEDETHVHNHTVDQNIHTEGDIHEGHDHDHDGEHDHGEELYHGGEHGHDHGGEHDHAEEHGHDHGGEHDHAEEHEHDHGGEHDHAEEHDHGGEHEHDHGGEHEHDHGDADHEHHRRKRHTEYDECLPAKLMLRLVQNDDQPRSLTKEMFKELCPSLIYQIDANTCHSSHSNNAHGDHDRFHDHGGHDHNDHDHAVHAESSAIDLSKVPPKVWGYSTIAVVIISLVGLLGVAVIPIMQKVFYNHMLQFLVAMAVGALSGDALLHLFPHAIAGGHGDEHGGHSHGEEGHYHDPAPIYKGLLGLFGIYFFFFTERVLTMFTEYKRKKKQKKNHNKYMKDEEMVKVGEKLANSECDGMMMSIHPNKGYVAFVIFLLLIFLINADGGEVLIGTAQALKGYADEAHTEHCTISFENTTRISHQHGQRQNCTEETCVDGDENTSMIGSVNSTPKSHGHRHGHSHGVDGVPDSVASVAWMVILGDGIHNFSDGLAIGAAFVNSITGGFSTSIAVFCHELPHEIGDFAMLLRAGMSPKQAIIYNCLSSILCFIGMLIGVAIGNLEGASLWIFSIVGGMFLYIALVDMLPELSAVETKKGEHPLCHLLLQGIGMCLGAGIMLAIALYEGELKTMLD